MVERNPAKDILLGVAVGDALGVPVEFMLRDHVQRNPVTGMRAFGTHQQPAGTWSDDSSLTFCLAEMLCNGYDLTALAGNFVNWREHGYWTPHGSVFDIGIATSIAIHNLKTGCPPLEAGGNDERSNGNGSLMRILPLLLYVKDKDVEERFKITQEISSLTHRHIRSVIGCFIYLEIALQLFSGKEKFAAVEAAREIVNAALKRNNLIPQLEIDKYHRLLCNPIGNYKIEPIQNFDEREISSGGYVLHTLEASVWCLLHTDSYAEAVLKAVNLGSDTDTTGAVTGGLAGLLYGWQSIPQEWLDVLVRRTAIEMLSDRLLNALPV